MNQDSSGPNAGSVSTSVPVPVIDIGPWLNGSDDDRAMVGAEVDRALREIGFLLVVNHGISIELRQRVREAATAFFTLPVHIKERYRAEIGERSWLPRGWTPTGAESNANSDDGVSAPPDLKESYSVACDQPTGDPVVDGEWFADNVWPAEVPEFHSATIEYLAQVRRLADELMALAAVALGLPERYFLQSADHPTWSFYVHWYPSLEHTGAPLDGQLRIGSHTDFGAFTILDRQQGTGGLQVLGKDGRWVDAPWIDGALTINIGDMMAQWSGDRWLSNRHRVLAPSDSTPDEELLSLVYFHEANPTATLRSVPPPIGRNEHPPVLAGSYLRDKLAAIAVVAPS
ncbi:2-oxoglutarate and iron-dependent oxygenase domain-containing protein [soil metagenome]